MTEGLLGIGLLALVIGGIWLSVKMMGVMARAVLADKPWVATLSRVALPLYAGTWSTHWAIGSERLSREMGSWVTVISAVSVILMTLALTNFTMRYYARRSDLGAMVVTGLFACIAWAIGCSLLLTVF